MYSTGEKRWKEKGESIMWLMEDFKMWTKYSDMYYAKEKIRKATATARKEEHKVPCQFVF